MWSTVRHRANVLASWLGNRAARARIRMFDRAPEGILLLDARQRIVDLNPAAERILGAAAASARGTNLTDLFPACEQAEPEIVLGADGDARHYALCRVSLGRRCGFPLGSLAVLRDITGQKRAHERILVEQSALATMRERDRLARELHDSLGQVLGYAKMQARAARDMLARGQIAEVDDCLARLGAVAQEAHADVHEYILGGAGLNGGGLASKLETYLQRFTGHYGIAARLDVASTWSDRACDPAVEAQLLRIIQEALSNVRKHAHARGVSVRLGVAGDRAEAVVQDDGAGFDPLVLDAPEGQKFGLSCMRERAREVGGSVEIHSMPGEGTRVVIDAPVRKERS
jgi:signal transduction histidine kinase